MVKGKIEIILNELPDGSFAQDVTVEGDPHELARCIYAVMLSDPTFDLIIEEVMVNKKHGFKMDIKKTDYKKHE